MTNGVWIGLGFMAVGLTLAGVVLYLINKEPKDG
jgi:uncharacterized membrane protein YbaN (DUF454 family)